MTLWGRMLGNETGKLALEEAMDLSYNRPENE